MVSMDFCACPGNLENVRSQTHASMDASVIMASALAGAPGSQENAGDVDGNSEEDDEEDSDSGEEENRHEVMGHEGRHEVVGYCMISWGMRRGVK
eukprot:1159338-Pelagomonas_calceolata.AAC.24